MSPDEYDRFLTVTYCVLAVLVTAQIINLFVLPIPAGFMAAALTFSFLGMGPYGLLIGQGRPQSARDRPHRKADRS